MIPWLVAAISLGFGAAFIARTKGRPFLPWLTYGTLLGIVAIPHALCLRRPDTLEDDEVEMRNRRDDSPKFTGSWAENWMENNSADTPRRRTGMTPGAPRRPDDVPPAWSDDAFARIVGDEPPLAEFGTVGGRASSGDRPKARTDEPPLAEFGASRDGGLPDAREPRDAAPTGYRPSSGNSGYPGGVPPARHGESSGAAPSRRDDARDSFHRPSPGRVNGDGMARRDFLGVARAEDGGRRTSENDRLREDDDQVPFTHEGHDSGVSDPQEAGRNEPRFEPRLEFEGNGWRAERRYGDNRYDDIRMARRYAPDPRDMEDAYPDTDRREPRRGGRVLSYAVAALCVVLAVVLVWPRPSDGPPPDRIASTTPAPASKGPDLGTSREPGVVTPESTPLVPQNPSTDDTFARSDTTVERSFAPPPAPPDEDAARAKGARSDADAAPPEGRSAQGAGAATGRSPRTAEDRASDGPKIKAAPSTDVARVDPAAPGAAAPPSAPAARSATVPPDRVVPKKAAPKKAAPNAPPTTTSTGASPTSTPPAKSESITAVGQMVVLVQAELKKRGYDPGELNGRAGDQTRQAIRAFKRKEGLAVNDTIDDELFEKLGIVGRRIHPFASSSR